MRGPLRTKGHLFDVFAVLALGFLGWLCWSTPFVTVDGADQRLFRGGLFFAGLAMLVLIAAVSHRGAFAGRMLGTPVLVWIGVRSYGLYLFHWPIFMIIRGVAGNPLSRSRVRHRDGRNRLRDRAVVPLLRDAHPAGGAVGRLAAVPSWHDGRAAPGPGRRYGGGAVRSRCSPSHRWRRHRCARTRSPKRSSDNEQFTTDLLDVRRRPPLDEDDAPGTTRPPSRTASTVVSGTVTDDTVPRAITATPPTETPTPGVDGAVTSVVVDSTAPPADDVNATAPTVPAPLVVAPPVLDGVVNDMSTMTPLVVPEPTNGGYKLVALGDSVMLGAAEELGAYGFLVDAVVSRQMKNYLPDMQSIRDMGIFGSAVVVHLGTNGPFSQETLDQTMAVLADVPVVLIDHQQGRARVGGGEQREGPGAPRVPSERHRARLGGVVSGVPW